MGCASAKQAPAKPPEKKEDEIEDNNVAPEWSEDDAEIVPCLESLMEAAKTAEPPITSLLKELEAEFDGELSGLEYKFKSRESMFRKIRKCVDRKRVEALNAGKEDEQVDIPAVVWSTTDALRYTILLPTEKYTPAVKAASERFEAQGMEASELKNFWPGGDNYQGINDVFRLKCENSPSTVMLFEVQFHTPESFKSKMDSHHFYETFRSSMDPMEKIKNWQALCEAAKKVPVPEGVLDIPEPRSNPNPGEKELYAELVLKRTMKAEPEVKAIVEKSCKGALRVGSKIATTGELEATLGLMVDGGYSDSVGLQEAVNKVYEALNITVVFPEDSYVQDCQKASWAMEGNFSVEGGRNGWLPVGAQAALTVGCGPGWSLYMTTPGEDDGVAFTDDDSLPCMVTLHTEASLGVKEELTEKWAQYRAATSGHKRRELIADIRQLYEAVRVPDGAQALTRVAIESV
mmetsp:Transcript_38003/g.109665  ORF Transcript_38003/g.109665 Transcript_38003/m.109665 type:complete len:461 (+) Transcript_38003:31-1413(+)